MQVKLADGSGRNDMVSNTEQGFLTKFGRAYVAAFGG